MKVSLWEWNPSQMLITKWYWCIYWILGLEVERHSMWVLWITLPSRMQRQLLLLEHRRGGQHFSSRVIFIFKKKLKKSKLPERYGLRVSTPIVWVDPSQEKTWWGCFRVHWVARSYDYVKWSFKIWKGKYVADL